MRLKFKKLFCLLMLSALFFSEISILARGGGGGRGGGGRGGGARMGGARMGGARFAGGRVGGARFAGGRVGGARFAGARAGHVGARQGARGMAGRHGAAGRHAAGRHRGAAGRHGRGRAGRHGRHNWNHWRNGNRWGRNWGGLGWWFGGFGWGWPWWWAGLGFWGVGWAALLAPSYGIVVPSTTVVEVPAEPEGYESDYESEGYEGEDSDYEPEYTEEQTQQQQYWRNLVPEDTQINENQKRANRLFSIVLDHVYKNDPDTIVAIRTLVQRDPEFRNLFTEIMHDPTELSKFTRELRKSSFRNSLKRQASSGNPMQSGASF